MYIFGMRPQPPLVPHPLGFFLTWVTYGSWLPGDRRGWTDRAGVIRQPNLRLACHAAAKLRQEPVGLAAFQWSIVEETVREHCDLRGWPLHAVSCRRQHVHVVVTTTSAAPAMVCQQLKAWTSRLLHEHGEQARPIWARGYSARRVYDEQGLAAVIEYVADCQDRPHSP